MADIEAIGNLSFVQEDERGGYADHDEDIPIRARVELGARPSFMEVSQDGERIAIVVHSEVTLPSVLFTLECWEMILHYSA